MGKGSRVKGCAFERRVAELIITAAGKRSFSKKDCYRTPMSGGHPYAGASDLVISKALRKVFPFCVECKNYKTWHPEQAFQPVKAMRDWAAQVVTASAHDKFLRVPLLAMSGNRTGVYVAIPSSFAKHWISPTSAPHLSFRACKRWWRMYPWAVMHSSIIAHRTS